MMKKVLPLLLFLSVTAAFAQFKGAPKKTVFSFGPKAGISASNFYGDTSMAHNLFKLNFHIGGMLNFAFNRSLSVQTECMYSPKGARFKDQTDSYDIVATYALNYLDIPLLFQYRGGDESADLFIQAGVQGSILLNAKYSGERKAPSYSETFSNSDIDSLGLPGNDLGAVLSLGFISEYGWNITLRANIGLTDLWEHDKELVNYNAVFQASVGYAFGRKYDVIGGRPPKRYPGK